MLKDVDGLSVIWFYPFHFQLVIITMYYLRNWLITSQIYWVLISWNHNPAKETAQLKLKKSPSFTLAVCGKSIRVLNHKMAESQNACSICGYLSTLNKFLSCTLQFGSPPHPIPITLVSKGAPRVGQPCKGLQKFILDHPGNSLLWVWVEWEVILWSKCIAMQQSFWTGK